MKFIALQPWGKPSAPIIISKAPGGTLVAFLTRHGKGHSISPSEVPARANIAALKSLGVRLIVAFSAVGSLREEIRPGDFAIPSQIIDRTKGVRPASFFQGLSIVAHAQFGDPFSNKLIQFLESRVRKALEGSGQELHTDKCIVCMEGPQFSTRAESKMYRSWGGDLINMSVLPEAKLAREAELRFVRFIYLSENENETKSCPVMLSLRQRRITTHGDHIPKPSPPRRSSRPSSRTQRHRDTSPQPYLRNFIQQLRAATSCLKKRVR